jgi:prevent-host-death family protein
MKKEPVIIGIDELRRKLSKTAHEVQDKNMQIIITQNGKKIAKIVPIDAKVDVNEKD